MKRIARKSIRCSADADISRGWWTKYYDSVTISDALNNTLDISPEQFVANQQVIANKYGLRFRGVIQAKDEYIEYLDNLWQLFWYTEDGNDGHIFFGEVSGRIIHPITQSMVVKEITDNGGRA